MDLSLDYITLNAFKSFRGCEKLNLAKLGQGVHFVRGHNYRKRLGSNGAGKSSLWDALTWCLYGCTADGLKNPDVKPWTGEKKTSVSVKLRVDDTKHELARTIGPNKLTIDGEVVGQEQVDQLIGLSFEVFNHTVLLGQGRPLFFDLGAKGKMELFSEVLDLARWDARSKVAAERASTFQSQLDLATGKLTGAEDHLTHLLSQIDASKLCVADWETKRQTRLADIDAEIANITKIVDAMQSDVDEATLDYDSAGTELKQIEVDLAKAQAAHDKLLKPFNEATRATTNAFVRLAECRAELAAMKVGAVCLMCKRPFTANSHATARESLRERIARYKKESEVINPVVAAMDNAEAKLRRLRDSEQEFKEKANNARDVLDLKQPNLATFKAKLEGLKDRKEHGDNEVNPYRVQLDGLRSQKKNVVAECSQLGDEIAGYARRIERAKFWVKGFRDIRLYVVDEVLQELELTTNAALEEVGLRGWEIQYSVERETKSGTVQQGLNVTILSPRNDKPVRWESFSGGEAQRLRLVGALALSEVLLAHAGVSTSMDILDEPTQHLSAEGVRDVCDYLVERARQHGRQTFYVDHTAVESTRFASVITIAKDKEGSYIDV